MASQLLPQSKALTDSTTYEFISRNILQRKNLKPAAVAFACLYLLSTGHENLFLIYTIVLGVAILTSAMNTIQESYNFGLFKHNKLTEIKEIEKPLYSPVDFS